MNKFSFFIGTHAPASGPSLYLCETDFESGAFTTLCTGQGISDPTYLAGPAEDILYCIGKTAEGGCVFALRLGDSPALTEDSPLSAVSTLSSGGQGPCHISVDARREFLLCANYGSGSVSLFALGRNGNILARSDFRQYSGAGFDWADRQKGPHAHFAAFHAEREEVLVCDLGLDQVYVYELDRAAGKLRDTNRSIRLPGGAGPRHLAFHKSHPGMLFVIAEMANSIFTYRYDTEEDKYAQVQSVSAVVAGVEKTEEENNAFEISESGITSPESRKITPSDPNLMIPATADNGSIGCAIRFTADGKYLFVSSRLGYQSISAFCCDRDGKLHFCSRCLCGGITPRDFNVFESAQTTYLLVANQDSDLITALAFDREREKLFLLDMKMSAVKPTCILPARSLPEACPDK